MNKKIAATAITEAAEAHTALCTFAHIEGILDTQNLRNDSSRRAAAKIVTICRSERQKQLKLYDKARNKILDEFE